MAATARTVDLSNVKEGGNFRPRRKPEGDYRGKIVKADDHQPNDKTKPMGWVLTIQVDGDARSTYPYYLSPDTKQAWKIRQVCIAAGINPKLARIKFDPNKLVNKAIGMSLEDDEYEGRPKSVIGELFPASEVGANADEGVEDEVEDIDTDEVEVPDDDEVPEDDEPEEEPEPVPTRRVKRKPVPEPEPEDDDEEEDEEPEPAPPVRRKRAVAPPAKKAAPRKATPPPADDDEDLDLDDLDD